MHPNLIFELIHTKSNTVLRKKIYEAFYAFTLKPAINDKE